MAWLLLGAAPFVAGVVWAAIKDWRITLYVAIFVAIVGACTASMAYGIHQMGWD